MRRLRERGAIANSKPPSNDTHNHNPQLAQQMSVAYASMRSGKANLASNFGSFAGLGSVAASVLWMSSPPETAVEECAEAKATIARNDRQHALELTERDVRYGEELKSVKQSHGRALAAFDNAQQKHKVKLAACESRRAKEVFDARNHVCEAHATSQAATRESQLETTTEPGKYTCETAASSEVSLSEPAGIALVALVLLLLIGSRIRASTKNHSTDAAFPSPTAEIARLNSQLEEAQLYSQRVEEALREENQKLLQQVQVTEAVLVEHSQVQYLLGAFRDAQLGLESEVTSLEQKVEYLHAHAPTV